MRLNWNQPPIYDAANVGITGGTGIPVRLVGGALPFVSAPTGTMANNGAVTLGTALARVIPSCWLLLPAGSIAAGVPAADTWYYAQMSSTTVGTVFNNIYTVGSTAAPASPTAFATTGPGAFTGSVAITAGPGVTLGAGVVGNLGGVHWEMSGSNNNSAGLKMYSVVFGTTQVANTTLTTVTTVGMQGNVTNQGDATHQMSDLAINSIQNLGSAPGATFPTENTATALAFALRVQKNTATDYVIIERYAEWLFAQASGNG